MSSNTTLSSLLLDHPTHQELLGTWKTNGEAWSGPLSPEAYLRRESHLCQQTLTREGGLTFWVLVDPVPAASSKPRRILASCETLRKKAWVTYPTDEEKSSVTEVICHSVGSVFTPPPLRGHGYAGCMIDQLGKALSTWQASDSPVREHQVPVAASVLFSDIGKVPMHWIVPQRASLTIPLELLCCARLASFPILPLQFTGCGWPLCRACLQAASVEAAVLVRLGHTLHI